MSARQFSTFTVAGRLYGVDVSEVQEITLPMKITRVPLAPPYVHGLINLRGQIATAIGLHELFELGQASDPEKAMNLICSGDGVLLSLLVDQVGDVMEMTEDHFEPTPETVSISISRFMEGVYKCPGQLLSVVNVKKIIELIHK